jgi:hypothetical protein
MMQKESIIVLLSLIYIINGDNDYGSSNCKRFENKIYQVSVTFPGLETFYAGLRLLPNNQFDEIFGIAGGNNAAEVGVDFALSSRVGNYKCLSRNYMRLTGFGFLYKTAGVPFLADSGANVMHDYYFSFYNNYRNCKGVVKYAVFKSGTNPFTTNDQPVFEGPIGNVTCEIFKFRSYYLLSGDF